jgi:hypothetical protein
MRVRAFRGRHDLLRAGVEPAVRDVLTDGAAEQTAILTRENHARAPGGKRKLGKRHAVHADGALARIVKSEEQVDDRRLAGARRADDRGRLSAGDAERDALEHCPLAPPVAEGHGLEGDLSRRRNGTRPEGM